MSELEFVFEDDPKERIFDKLIAPLKPGEKLTASAILTALDGEGEMEAFGEMDILVVPLDISDLSKTAGTGEAALRLRQEEQAAEKGLSPEALEPGDPLRLYLEEIASIPVCGDVTVLAEELCRTNLENRDASELCTKLLNLSLSRVVEIAREYTGYGVLLLDLIQEGSMGLWQYLNQYTGGDIEKYRDNCIHHAMKKAVILQAHANGVGSKMRQAMEDYRSVDERLLSELGRNPSVEEIAEGLHITAEAAAAIGKMVENARRLQQAKRVPDEEEEKEAQEQAVEDTAYFQTRQRVNEMLSGLNETEVKVITLRFGLEGGLPLSPEETGRKLGLTPDEVVKAETAALAKMRKQ